MPTAGSETQDCNWICTVGTGPSQRLESWPVLCQLQRLDARGFGMSCLQYGDGPSVSLLQSFVLDALEKSVLEMNIYILQNGNSSRGTRKFHLSALSVQPCNLKLKGQPLHEVT